MYNNNIKSSMLPWSTWTVYKGSYPVLAQSTN